MAFRSSVGRYSKGFSPPLSMQGSVWNSILNGDFIDAKIFAFSRRSHVPGRVTTPRPLFVNTHVLATACSYFESTFSFSGGIETDIDAGLPPDTEPFFDMEECDLGSDFDRDLPQPMCVTPQPQPPTTPKPPQRTVKTYVVKYTAYRTLRAIVWYIYTGEIFSSNSSYGFRASAKSVYRFADEHSMEQLKALAAESIRSSIDRLSPSKFVEEACSVSCNAFTSRYPEWSPIYAERLSLVVSADWEAKCAFQSKLSAYFCGELPHCKEIITSTCLRLVNNSVDRRSHHPPPGDHGTISRVSDPWPGWTRDALSQSLDSGVFDGFKLSVFDARETTRQLIYLPSMLVDDESENSLALCTRGFSIRTWQAIVYYKYTGCITFAPLGSRQSGGVLAVGNPSDPLFRGYPCPMKEMYKLALQLGYSEMTEIATTEIVSSLTLENVVEEMFSGSPLPADAIRRGLEIMRGSGRDSELRMSSQLREALEAAADGSKSGNFGALWACLDELTSRFRRKQG